MDDFAKSLEEARKDPKQVLLEEAWHAEQLRKQYDIIRVSNPTAITIKSIVYPLPQVDFYVKYDVGKFQKIPYNSTMDIPRFRAIRYVEHKKDEIVNFIAKKMHDEFIAERDRKGLPRFVDKATENKETYETQSYPKTDDPELINEVFNQLWVGLVNRAASDTPPDQPNQGPIDLSTTAQKAIDNLESKVVPEDQRPPEATQPNFEDKPISPFAQMNQKLTPEEVEA